MKKIMIEVSNECHDKLSSRTLFSNHKNIASYLAARVEYDTMREHKKVRLNKTNKK